MKFQEPFSYFQMTFCSAAEAGKSASVMEPVFPSSMESNLPTVAWTQGPLWHNQKNQSFYFILDETITSIVPELDLLRTFADPWPAAQTQDWRAGRTSVVGLNTTWFWSRFFLGCTTQKVPKQQTKPSS